MLSVNIGASRYTMAVWMVRNTANCWTRMDLLWWHTSYRTLPVDIARSG